MSLLSSVTNALCMYGRGEKHYIRTITETNGNSELGVAGTRTIVDTPVVIPVVAFTDNFDKEIASQNLALVRKNFIIFFDATITASLVGNANGIVVGGTYSESTHVVTGGIFYVFEHTTAVPQYLDTDTACGVAIKGTFKA